MSPFSHREVYSISTHAPRTGSDGVLHPARRQRTISTHAPRTGSDEDCSRAFRANAISTHAPRTGSDATTRCVNPSNVGFQPTLPARGATKGILYQSAWSRFQPTLPARGATRHKDRRTRAALYFNPRSPHGERPLRQTDTPPEQLISTHAPRTGSDTCARVMDRIPAISTHAPRTGSDFYSLLVGQCALPHFNPRSPHGERRNISPIKISQKVNFNPRSPHGERLTPRRGFIPTTTISTHAPRTGSDLNPVDSHKSFYDFNPRSPHGERRPPADRPAPEQ